MRNFLARFFVTILLYKKKLELGSDVTFVKKNEFLILNQ